MDLKKLCNKNEWGMEKEVERGPMRVMQPGLFGGMELVSVGTTGKTGAKAGRSVKEVHEDYEGFVEKFKPKKTTDDCMTPPAVYESILQYVREVTGIGEDRRVVRPFWPGGDYENYPYEEGDVVVDNPPFSILARILDFYIARGICFWLFAPHITLFAHAKRPVTLVVVSARVVYENGAKVNTGFITNLWPGSPAVVADGRLNLRIKEAMKRLKGRGKVEPPKYSYPGNLLTSTYLGSYISGRGGFLEIPREEVEPVGALDSMRSSKGAVFGGGILVSDAVAERAAAERAAAERVVIEWPLSEREREIIRRLNRAGMTEEGADGGEEGHRPV